MRLEEYAMPERMMDEFGRWAIRLLKFVAVYILVIAMMIMVARAFAQPPPRRVVVQPTKEEARWYAQRYKHHGIWISIEEPGERYFERDGGKCRL